MQPSASLSAACSRHWVPTERYDSAAQRTAAPQKCLLVQPQPPVKVSDKGAHSQPYAFCTLKEFAHGENTRRTSERASTDPAAVYDGLCHERSIALGTPFGL